MRSRLHIFMALMLTAVCVVALRAQDPRSPGTPGLLPSDATSPAAELAQGPTRLADRLQTIRNSATSGAASQPNPSTPSDPPMPPDPQAAAGRPGDGTEMRSVLKRRPADAAPVPRVAPSSGPGASDPPRTLREAVQNNSAWSQSQGTERAGARTARRDDTTARELVPAPERAVARDAVNRAESLLALRSDAPALSVRAEGPESIVVGTEAVYRITVTNTGTEPSHEVLIRAALPSSVRIAGRQATQGGATIESGNGGTNLITWQLSQVMAGSDEQLSIAVVPEDSRPFELLLEWIAKPRALVAQVEVREPKLEMAISGPAELAYGETKVYRITLSNPGNGDAENVSVNLSSAGESAAPNMIGTLSAGETRQLEFEITGRDAGIMELEAVAMADAGLRAEAAHSIRVRRARLAVDITGPALKYAGTPATYEIRVANPGDATAADVTAHVAVPTGATFIGGTTGATPTASSIGFRMGDLPPGTERVISVKYQLMRPGANQITASADSADGLTAAGSVTTQVEAAADLKLIVNDPQGPMPVGQDAVYEIQIVNRGTKAASHIQVVAQFSEGIEPAASAGHGAELVPGQVIFQPIDTLRPGETRELKITARADRAGSHRFRVEVKCESTETRLVAEETTRFFQ